MRSAMLAGIAIATVAIATSAHATPVTTTNDALPIGQDVTLNNITSYAPIGVISGQDVFTLDAASTAALGTDTIYAWCIDVFHLIYPGANSYSFNLGAGIPTDSATPSPHQISAPTWSIMAGLMEIGNGILQHGDLAGANAHYGVSGTLDEWSAAIQLAIWDVEYQPNYGALNWSGSDATTRSIYNALVGDPTIAGTASSLLAIGSQQSFGDATGSINLTGVPVPEPLSIALLGVGIVGIGAIRHRRSNAAA